MWPTARWPRWPPWPRSGRPPPRSRARRDRRGGVADSPTGSARRTATTRRRQPALARSRAGGTGGPASGRSGGRAPALRRRRGRPGRPPHRRRGPRHPGPVTDATSARRGAAARAGRHRGAAARTRRPGAPMGFRRGRRAGPGDGRAQPPFRRRPPPPSRGWTGCGRGSPAASRPTRIAGQYADRRAVDAPDRAPGRGRRRADPLGAVAASTACGPTSRCSSTSTPRASRSRRTRPAGPSTPTATGSCGPSSTPGIDADAPALRRPTTRSTTRRCGTCTATSTRGGRPVPDGALVDDGGHGTHVAGIIAGAIAPWLAGKPERSVHATESRYNVDEPRASRCARRAPSTTPTSWPGWRRGPSWSA